jgi:hypothetical protein
VPPDQSVQFGRRDRLLDDAQDVDAVGSRHDFDRGEQRALVDAGENDGNRNAGFAQVAHEFHTVHAGHVEIADHDIDDRVARHDDPKRRLAVGCARNFGRTEPFEHAHQYAKLKRMILDCQEIQAGGVHVSSWQ